MTEKEEGKWTFLFVVYLFFPYIAMIPYYKGYIWDHPPVFKKIFVVIMGITSTISMYLSYKIIIYNSIIWFPFSIPGLGNIFITLPALLIFSFIYTMFNQFIKKESKNETI